MGISLLLWTIFFWTVPAVASASLIRLACHLLPPVQEADVNSLWIRSGIDGQTVDQSILRLDLARAIANDKPLSLRHLGSEIRRFLGRDR
jgi:hypothetical protein